jgi:hypothetical protein
MWLILFRHVIYFGPLSQKYPDLRKTQKGRKLETVGFSANPTMM